MRQFLSPAMLMAALGSVTVATPALADSGPRVEALVGWDRVSLDEGQYGLGTYSKSGFSYGGAVGYDWPVAPLVSVGVDGEIDGSTARYNYGGAGVQTGRDLYVGGRATFSLTPMTNLYAKVGFADARISANVPGLYMAGNHDGVRFGVGAQQSLAPHVYALLEYRHTSYQDNLSRNQLLTGIGLRF
ncbi:MAG: porin family protein [Sphingomonadales bacterium]|nr:porin family protein [Sphingomonadales bacterium]MDE2169998.1 porin family protein [Sphingomonadales bacterium]